MKKIIIILCLTAFAVSCGKKDNKVSSTADTSGTDALTIGSLVNFAGDYDIVQKDSNDCSNAIRIVNDCNGVKILSNGFNAQEEFCNVNRGTFRTNDRDTRNDRNPGNNRNPGRDQETQTVTLQGSQLTQVLRISDQVSFTNQLTLDGNGYLIKVSNLKSRQSRCVYHKR